MKRVAWLLILSLILSFGSWSSRRVAAEPPPATVGRIAYQGSDQQLHLMNADGTGDTVIPTLGAVVRPRWSPISNDILYLEVLSTEPYRTQLSMVNLITGATHIVAPPKIRIPDLELYWTYQQPHWTPDGKSVIYLRSGGARAVTIARVAVSGGPSTDLFFGTSQTSFDLSPVDGRFAITDTAFAEEPVQGSQLVVADPDGNNQRVVRPRAGIFYSQPTWTPDGRAIAVRRQSDRASAVDTLLLIDPESGAERTLGALPRNSTYSFAPDGHTVLLANSETGQLELLNSSDLTPRRPLGSGAAPSWEPARRFGETGYVVRGGFLHYWEQNGGLPIYGYPLTGEFEQHLADGQTYTVQYFERARFEYHPNNPDAYKVLLGQFGRYFHPADQPVPAETGSRYFAETGHNLRGPFLDYWTRHGGLAQFGYPLTEQISEQLEDGNRYTVQYFERARFEWHPENPAPYQVLLGQFGRRVCGDRCR